MISTTEVIRINASQLATNALNLAHEAGAIAGLPAPTTTLGKRQRVPDSVVNTLRERLVSFSRFLLTYNIISHSDFPVIVTYFEAALKIRENFDDDDDDEVTMAALKDDPFTLFCFSTLIAQKGPYTCTDKTFDTATYFSAYNEASVIKPFLPYISKKKFFEFEAKLFLQLVTTQAQITRDRVNQYVEFMPPFNYMQANKEQTNTASASAPKQSSIDTTRAATFSAQLLRHGRPTHPKLIQEIENFLNVLQDYNVTQPSQFPIMLAFVEATMLVRDSIKYDALKNNSLLLFVLSALIAQKSHYSTKDMPSNSYTYLCYYDKAIDTKSFYEYEAELAAKIVFGEEDFVKPERIEALTTWLKDPDSLEAAVMMMSINPPAGRLRPGGR